MSRVDERLIHDVIMLNHQGMSRRAIARALKISRNTVRQIVDEHGHSRQSQHSAFPKKRYRLRPSKLDPFRLQIDELFRTYPDITAQRVYEHLCEKGFDGGYSVVKDLVRRIRPKKPPTPSLETDPQVPAEKAECDWSPYTVTFINGQSMTLQAFGYTLRYSTRKFYSFHESNGLHPLMDGHVHAFERFGGAAHQCKYDSQKPVVLRWEGNQPILNLRFVDFATYYEFSPDICRRGHPNDKPRVEKSFSELNVSFFNGRSFRDVDDLRAQLVYWMDHTADTRPLKRRRDRTRLELFFEEQPLLRPLPCHHYDTARVLYKLCDIEGFIAWEGNWYSLPYEYVTDILPVRITENELFIYKPDLSCIARHALLPRGAKLRSILEGHRPRHAERGPDLAQLRHAFSSMGAGAADFLASLEKHCPRSAGYHARKILALRDSYATDDLLDSFAHALAYGALEHTSIERILLVRARPRRLGEYIAEQTAQKFHNAVAHSNTEPRDLAEYDSLPCAGATNHRPGGTPCPDGTALTTNSMNESKNTLSDSD